MFKQIFDTASIVVW